MRCHETGSRRADRGFHTSSRTVRIVSDNPGTGQRAACQSPLSRPADSHVGTSGSISGSRIDAPSLSRWDLIAALVFLLAALVSAWLYRFFQSDDAFISYRYVTNLMQGRGWVYNPGEAVNGASSPLHIMLLTLLGFLIRDIPLAAHLLGATFLALAAWLWYRVVCRLGRPEGGFAVGLVLVTNPFLLSTFGMETMLYLGLAMAALHAYHTGRVVLSAAIVGLLILARADGVLLAAVLLVHHLSERRRVPVAAVAVAGAVSAPWFLFSLLHFGSPWPSTLGARVAQGVAHHGLRFFQGTLFWAMHCLRESLWHLVLVPCAAVGLYGLLKHARTYVTIPLWAIVYFGAYSLLGVPYQHWYYGPSVFALAAVSGLCLLCIERARSAARAAVVWATMLLATVVGANVILRVGQETYIRLRGEHSWETLRAVASISSAGVWLPLALGLAAAVVAVTVRQHPVRARWALAATLFLPLVTAQVRLVYLHSRTYPTAQVTAYREVGTWLRQHTPPGSVVAAWEIGAIGYYSDRPILDYLGLITPAAQEHVARGDYSWWVHERPPDYVIVRDPPGGFELAALEDPLFPQVYEHSVTLHTPDWYPMIIYGRAPAQTHARGDEDSRPALDADVPSPWRRATPTDPGYLR